MELMMDIERVLLEEADYVASSIQGGARALEAELRELEVGKVQIDAKLHAANRSRQRLLGFQHRIGRDYQCPRCWIQNEARSALSPIPGTDEHDIMRCHACGADFVIPLD